MTRRVFWILVGSMAGVGCNCEEMLATKRTGAPPPIVARPVEAEGASAAPPVENAQPYRPPPVAQVPSPLPAQRPIPVIPAPGSVPVPEPEPAAANDGPLPADTPVDGPVAPVPVGGVGVRPLKPIRFPTGLAKSLFNRGAPVMSAPPAGVVGETKARK